MGNHIKTTNWHDFRWPWVIAFTLISTTRLAANCWLTVNYASCSLCEVNLENCVNLDIRRSMINTQNANALIDIINTYNLNYIIIISGLRRLERVIYRRQRKKDKVWKLSKNKTLSMRNHKVHVRPQRQSCWKHVLGCANKCAAVSSKFR